MKDRQYSFPRERRMLKRRDFLEVNQQGERFTSSLFVVVVRKRQDGAIRIGITASRKVGGAVVRNRIKRLVRETFRLNMAWFIPGDYSIIARPGVARLDFSGVCRELGRVLQQLQVQHG